MLVRVPTPLTVCLINHSTNSDNLGVGALTVSEINILRSIAKRELRILVVDWKDTRTPYVEGDDIEIVRVSSRDILDPRGLLRVYGRADLVVDIGAGDSFSDIYGQKRLNLMFAAKFLAHGRRLPVIMAPQTIGPFKNPVNRHIAARHLSLCRAVFARDELSLAALRELGAVDRSYLASDVALELPYDPPAPRPAGGPVRVGLNVSGLLMNGGYTRSNMFGLKDSYPDLIAALIHDFTAREGVELHLVGHVLSETQEVEDDWRASQALAERHPGLVLAPRFTSPSEAKSYIAGLDFFAGARMHATIAAFSSGVPVVPMAYSRKFEGLFGSLGYDRVVDCTSQSAETIRTAIAAAFDDRQTVAAEVAQALAIGRDRLGVYRNKLAQIFDEVTVKR